MHAKTHALRGLTEVNSLCTKQTKQTQTQALHNVIPVKKKTPKMTYFIILFQRDIAKLLIQRTFVSLNTSDAVWLQKSSLMSPLRPAPERE